MDMLRILSPEFSVLRSNQAEMFEDQLRSLSEDHFTQLVEVNEASGV